MSYDFNKPYKDVEELAAYKAIDRDVSKDFGHIVLATLLSNREYQHRFDELKNSNNMRKPPLSGRIFSGYLVIRNLGRKNQYETWIPDDAFEEIYEKVTLKR